MTIIATVIICFFLLGFILIDIAENISRFLLTLSVGSGWILFFTNFHSLYDVIGPLVVILIFILIIATIVLFIESYDKDYFDK